MIVIRVVSDTLLRGGYLPVFMLVRAGEQTGIVYMCVRTIPSEASVSITGVFIWPPFLNPRSSHPS